MKRRIESLHDWFFSDRVNSFVYRAWLFAISLLLIDLILKALS